MTDFLIDTEVYNELQWEKTTINKVHELICKGTVAGIEAINYNLPVGLVFYIIVGSGTAYAVQAEINEDSGFLDIYKANINKKYIKI